MKVTFLGTGTSHGIPMIACNCKVCTSDNPKNKRMRTSVLVHSNSSNILIDAPPELRLQCIKNNVTKLDAVLITHAHADHIFGLDDIRRFNIVQHMDMPIYGAASTLDTIRNVFSYVFNGERDSGGFKPRFSLNVIHDRVKIGNLSVAPVEAIHGDGQVTGYRFEKFAYITDVNKIPAESLEKLRGLDVLVLGALRYIPHAKHFSIEQALSVVEKLRPHKAYFTHMCHDIEHEEANRKLPAGVEFAFDGLVIEV
ncbi:MAG: Metal-dependent hydrolase of the beta-lactamase superfamily I [Candidatus Jettenia ecosi]|uniref:Metal-dependent hydrolase of the beta-lactamase superfamily I n=1 Tax=Candidatus Jettenia ecosi TaxID=2494326 RepID=A0A533QK28_9BACT|nr:MAG: Metal-dependent hydrolase of the beta-lactamase superfamily I [Candidatus Jettenia ecosi]